MQNFTFLTLKLVYYREEWQAYDPYLIAEGLFGAGMISSFLKIVQILSINPHLGPLQISLGRMIMDILKWIALGIVEIIIGEIFFI